MSPHVRSDRAFGRDVIFNMASLGFLATAGLVLNFAIGRFYGPAALGLFNIVFALYIFLSQLGVLGIHFSTLKHVSEHAVNDSAKSDAAIAGAVMLTAVVTTAVTLLAALATPLVARVYALEGIRTAWLAILPGLWCFSINKVLIAAINGAEHMRAFAVLQSLRHLFILVALCVVLLTRPSAEWVVAVITAGEVLLLPVLLFYLRRIVSRWDWQGGMQWLKTHFDFGVRVFMSGTVGELNTRVDVLLLGTMLDSTRAGIYSIALLLAEGFAQAIVVLRANLNPIITRQLSSGNTEELSRFGRRLSGWFALFMLVSGTALVVGFALVVPIILPDGGFADAVWPLAILVGGLVIASPYMPFGMILSQAGLPLEQTLFTVAILVFNLVLNAALIPTLGILGAAMATSSSYVFTACLLIFILDRRFGIRLWI